MHPPRPVQQWDAALLRRAQNVRVLFLDVDGVLTDGSLWFSGAGEVLKRFHTLDGHGIKLVQQAGVACAVISGRNAAPLRLRLQNLGIRHAHLGTENKLPAAQAVLHQLQLDWSQAAAMGDDWPDLPLLRHAQLACAPPDAHPEVLAAAHWVAHRAGGAGAVRELCDLLLAAHGQYARQLAACCAAAPAP